MSLVVLANGERFEIEPPEGVHEGILHQRQRQILLLNFRAAVDQFNTIKKVFYDPQNTENIRIYFAEEKASATDEQLEGVAHEDYQGFTMLGDIRETDKIIEEGTPARPPKYGRQLTIELGQRLYGE